MSRILSDGTPVQDGLRTFERQENFDMQYIPFPIKCMVTNVYHVDSENNAVGETLMCDVHAIRWGFDLYGVPLALEKGSADNFIDYRITPCDKNLDENGAETPATDKSLIDTKLTLGDMVLVQFIDGDIQQGIITKTIPHTQSGKNGKCPYPRKGKDAGDHYRIRMNGCEFMIDKDGNLEITNTKTMNQKTQPNKKVKVKLSVEKNDPAVPDDQKQSVEFTIDNTKDAPKVEMIVTDNTNDQKKQKILLDGTARTIKVTNEHENGENSIEFSPAGISLNIKGDTNLTLDGLANITAKDNLTIIAEKLTTITAKDNLTLNAEKDVEATISGKLTATVTGDAKIESSSKAIVEAPAIELGEGATEAVVKGTAFKTWVTAHTHPTAVGPSGPPTEAATFDVPPGTHLSTIVTTK